MDVGSDEKIDYGVFILASTDRHKLLTEEALEAAFKMFDQDEKGNISTSDFRTYFISRGDVELERDMWSKLTASIEISDDQTISKEQFTKAMSEIVQIEAGSN